LNWFDSVVAEAFLLAQSLMGAPAAAACACIPANLPGVAARKPMGDGPTAHFKHPVQTNETNKTNITNIIIL